jgi:hypothetical protein
VLGGITIPITKNWPRSYETTLAGEIKTSVTKPFYENKIRSKLPEGAYGKLDKTLKKII